MQPALQIRGEHGHRLDALLVGEVLHPLLAELIDRRACHALGLEVEFFEFGIRKFEEVAELGHRCVLFSFSANEKGVTPLKGTPPPGDTLT